MRTSRLEAFSDGVFAILITIMVLDLHVPAGLGAAALRPLAATLAMYALSFVFLAIYWSNHHHLLHLAKRVTGGVLWANLVLLFWLSLVPFATKWVGEQGLQALPVALYGAVLLASGCSYFLLYSVLRRAHGSGSAYELALRPSLKDYGSLLAYAVAIALAFLEPRGSLFLILVVALVWLVPDQRIENYMLHAPEEPESTGGKNL